MGQRRICSSVRRIQRGTSHIRCYATSPGSAPIRPLQVGWFSHWGKSPLLPSLSHMKLVYGADGIQLAWRRWVVNDILELDREALIDPRQQEIKMTDWDEGARTKFKWETIRAVALGSVGFLIMGVFTVALWKPRENLKLAQLRAVDEFVQASYQYTSTCGDLISHDEARYVELWQGEHFDKYRMSLAKLSAYFGDDLSSRIKSCNRANEAMSIPLKAKVKKEKWDESQARALRRALKDEHMCLAKEARSLASLGF